jgi:hypothetical protein
MNEPLARPVAMTLYQDDTDLLDAIGREHGIRTRSAVARFIFRDWAKLKRAAIHAAAPLDQLDMAVTGAYDEPLTAN